MKVKAIRPAGKEPVYNMTVEEFHNYIIHGGIVLKNCDALRYFCVTRTLGAERVFAKDDYDDEPVMDYDDQMTGGDVDRSYLTYGGD